MQFAFNELETTNTSDSSQYVKVIIQSKQYFTRVNSVRQENIARLHKK